MKTVIDVLLSMVLLYFCETLCLSSPKRSHDTALHEVNDKCGISCSSRCDRRTDGQVNRHVINAATSAAAAANMKYSFTQNSRQDPAHTADDTQLAVN